MKIIDKLTNLATRNVIFAALLVALAIPVISLIGISFIVGFTFKMLALVLNVTGSLLMFDSDMAVREIRTSAIEEE